MITAVCLGTNDLARAGDFYDEVLGIIDMKRLVADEKEVGYGQAGGEPTLWVLLPFNGESASNGNGTQIIFKAPDQQSVDLFHQKVIERGGTDEGAPGPRDYAPGYYGAYCRDLDANKLHVYVMLA